MLQTDSEHLFSFVSKKTDDDLTIFLVLGAAELYKKYVSIPTNGQAFPSKSNQKMNDNYSWFMPLRRGCPRR